MIRLLGTFLLILAVLVGYQLAIRGSHFESTVKSMTATENNKGPAEVVGKALDSVAEDVAEAIRRKNAERQELLPDEGEEGEANGHGDQRQL